jgi:hypothetical protein
LALFGASVADINRVSFHSGAGLFLSFAFTTIFAVVAGLLSSIMLLVANASLFAKRAIFALLFIVGLIIAIQYGTMLLFRAFEPSIWSYLAGEGLNLPIISVSIVSLIASILLVASSIAKLRAIRKPPPDALFPIRSRIILPFLTGAGGILFFPALLGSSLGFHQWPFWQKAYWLAPATIGLVAIILSIVLIIRSSAASDLASGAILALTLASVTYALIVTYELIVMPQSTGTPSELVVVGTVFGLAAALCLISAAVIALRSARHSILTTQRPTEARAPVAG